MPWQLPVDFLQQANNTPAAGAVNQPPKVIKASDLMKSFSYAALDADDTLIETQTATGGHQKRKLKIPAVPSGNLDYALSAKGGTLSWSPYFPTAPTSGTYILGAVSGALTWIATEEC